MTGIGDGLPRRSKIRDRPDWIVVAAGRIAAIRAGLAEAV
jgi:hypothetical protein